MTDTSSHQPVGTWSSVFDYLMESSFGVDGDVDTSASRRVPDRSVRLAMERALAEPSRSRPLNEILTSGARAVVILPRHSGSPPRELMQLFADYLDAWSTCHQLDVIVLSDTPTGHFPESPDNLLPWEQAGATLHRIDLIARDDRPDAAWGALLAAVRRADLVVVFEYLNSLGIAASIESAVTLDEQAAAGVSWAKFLKWDYVQRLDRMFHMRELVTYSRIDTGRFFAVCAAVQGDQIKFAAGAPEASLQLLKSDTANSAPVSAADSWHRGLVAVVERPWSLNLEHAFSLAAALNLSLHRKLSPDAPFLIALEGLEQHGAPGPDLSMSRRMRDIARWVRARARGETYDSSIGFDALFDNLACYIYGDALKRPLIFVHPMLTECRNGSVRRYRSLADGLEDWTREVNNVESEDRPTDVTLMQNPQNQWALFRQLRRPVQPIWSR